MCLVRNSNTYKSKCCRGKAGTPVFLSPEVIRTSYSLSASDVWALGITIFSTASGVYPFDFGDESVSSVLNVIESYKPAKLDTGNKKLDKLTNSMLTKNPVYRINSRQIYNNFRNKKDLYKYLLI